MRASVARVIAFGCAVAARSAQGPASSFPRGRSLQSWQDPVLAGVLATCKTRPQSFAIPVRALKPGEQPPAAPTPAPLPTSTAIPSVIRHQ